METLFWNFLIEQIELNEIRVEFNALEDTMVEYECKYNLWVRDLRDNVLMSVIVNEKEKKMFEYMTLIKNIKN